MIVKIKHYSIAGSPLAMPPEKSYSIWDGFDHIEYGDYLSKCNYEFAFEKLETPGIRVFSIPSICKCSEQEHCRDCVPVVVLTCYKGDQMLNIAFDTQAFLLNDNGKTIERIVANYDPTGPSVVK